ncbi:hypothetical protein [Kribbella antiqua]|uniref:hypothetical protein n=1 Tax=Kribbella antiqua TaxID=2512217 RepID=UPI00104BFFD6|nr:hypothetical protein [Kribbella antiqua]
MSLPSRRRVRLWFGQHLIADYIGDQASADRHEAAMRRRFPGLEITNQPLRAADYNPADLHR